MSQENVEIVQRALAAYVNEDEATLRALADDDMVTSARPDQPDPEITTAMRVSCDRRPNGLKRGMTMRSRRHASGVQRDFVFVGTQESGRGRVSGVPMETQFTSSSL